MDDGGEKEITRRELFTGKVAERKESEYPKIEEPIKIGNMNLFVLPIEHNQKSWEENQDIVR